MLTPPFKRSAGGSVALEAAVFAITSTDPDIAGCCPADHGAHDTTVPAQLRGKLHQLDPHLHCSVIGTCLSTGDLRRLMAKHVQVQGMNDLDVHHLAVTMAMEGGEVSKAIHKALDQRHAGPIRVFSSATDEASLEAAWRQAWQQGDIPGAYWALLTHKAVTMELRQLAFGEIHMLSHLMGSANRDELRRFVVLEKENSELHDKLDREQAHHQETQLERDALAEQLRRQSLDFEARLAQAKASLPARASSDNSADLVALHTERREHAERVAKEAQEEVERVRLQMEHQQQQLQQLSEELVAAETELQQLSARPDGTPDGQIAPHVLKDRRVLYVGGRPSSTPAIRDFVHRCGGEFLHHDGGLESRKGLLAAQLPRADVALFPVDCVDHDSMLSVKRLCERHGVPFIALRTASLGSFAAAVTRELGASSSSPDRPPRFCLRHG